MPKPKNNVKPLDMTSDEAVNFLFPKEAVEEMKKLANPDTQRVSEQDENCDDQPYSEDNR
jgi:hypothetical protein